MFNVLLLASGILSFILFAIDISNKTNLYLGVILIVIACGNAFIDLYQKHHTAKILESFLHLAPPTCVVLREGLLVVISAQEVVAGDVIYYKAGDKSPADCRLFYTVDMKVDNSVITGESESLERSVEPCEEASPLEANNLILSGTTIVNGEGYGIAIRTGDRSVFGQIASLTIKEKTPKSQLEREIGSYVRYLAAVALLVAIIFFVTCLLLGYGLGLTFCFAVGIFVGFVPQGLPLTVSTLLTIAAKRMAERKVLVKNLHTVETLGAITLLATDKTGTLTQNKMVVVGIWLNTRCFSTTEHQPVEEAGGSLGNTEPNLESIVQACALCSKAKISNPAEGQESVGAKFFGDATEIALLNFASQYSKVEVLHEMHPKIFEIPFNSSTKWHLTVHRFEHEHGHYVAFIKGAPERVASMCHFIQFGAQAIPWSETVTADFNSAYEHFATRGRRLLGVACLPLNNQDFPEGFDFSKGHTELPMNQFVFLGILAIMDPPKRGVRKAIAALRTAGIQLVMVTGDHPLTAEAIARQIGLVTGENIIQASMRLMKPIHSVGEEEYDAVVVHGEQLVNMSDEDWDRILAKKEVVFARTSPQQKLDIVTKFQKKGHIVGVSGDGINDSPALKRADLGISMNQTASDVSKEAASMILLDDHFPSIVNGISEGRLIFTNLKKSIRYTITHTMPEVMAFVMFVILGIPLPINSLLLLLIDLGSELAPALSFAFESPETDLMLVPPRKVLCQLLLGHQNSGNDTSNEKAGFIQKLKTACEKIKRRAGRKETGETLVDLDMILWSFFEAGIIETLGCFGAYLITWAYFQVPLNILPGSAKTFWMKSSPDLSLGNGKTISANTQVAISGSTQSAYYAGIVICQVFVLWMAKHRYTYPTLIELFRNKMSILGAGMALSVAAIIIYVPGLNNVVLGGGPVPILALLAPFGAGCGLVLYEFIRVYCRRRGWFGGIPKTNNNLVELVRTTSSIKN